MDWISAAAAARDERERVDELIKRDRRDAIRDDERKLAELEVRDGVFVNLADTVIEPTAEWMGKGDTQPFTPRQPDGTVRTIRTVRRVVTPMVKRMHNAGKITDEQLSACLWYREVHDRAGLEGRYSSSRYGIESSMGGGQSSGSPAVRGHMPMTMEEAGARQAFRAAREAVTKFYLRFFDAIVIDDVPLRRATRFAKCRDEKGSSRFRMVAQEMANFCERMQIEARGAEKN